MIYITLDQLASAQIVTQARQAFGTHPAPHQAPPHPSATIVGSVRRIPHLPVAAPTT